MGTFSETLRTHYVLLTLAKSFTMHRSVSGLEDVALTNFVTRFAAETGHIMKLLTNNRVSEHEKCDHEKVLQKSKSNPC